MTQTNSAPLSNQEFDHELLSYIQNHPGCTAYQAATGRSWRVGAVLRSLGRLETKRLIRISRRPIQWTCRARKRAPKRKGQPKGDARP